MSGAAVTVLRRIAADHPAFAGHFPGRPVLPGALLLAEVLAAALAVPALAARLGATPTVVAAKFLAPVGPGSELTLCLRLEARALRFDVHCDGVAVCKGQYAVGEPR